MSDTQINSLVVVLFVWCWLNPNYEGMVAEGVIGWVTGGSALEVCKAAF